jgi:hypothetical protein
MTTRLSASNRKSPLIAANARRDWPGVANPPVTGELHPVSADPTAEATPMSILRKRPASTPKPTNARCADAQETITPSAWLNSATSRRSP